MKNIKTYILPLIILIFTITACDVIEEPYLVPLGEKPPEPGVKVKKVLLEEFTGHKCPNCPEATEEAKNLKGIYGEQIVIMAIHAGGLATPDASGLYTADFTTSTGNTVYAKYDPGYVPCGSVNRMNDKAEFYTSWQADVETLLTEPQEANIVINSTFDDINFALDVTVDVEFLVDLTGTYNLCFYVLESGIIAPQLSDTGDIPVYQHDHMLRGSHGGAWGLEIASGNILAGETASKEFQVTIEQGWIPEETSVVAFITDDATFRVLQAEEKHITAF